MSASALSGVHCVLAADLLPGLIDSIDLIFIARSWTAHLGDYAGRSLESKISSFQNSIVSMIVLTLTSVM